MYTVRAIFVQIKTSVHHIATKVSETQNIGHHLLLTWAGSKRNVCLLFKLIPHKCLILLISATIKWPITEK